MRVVTIPALDFQFDSLYDEKMSGLTRPRLQETTLGKRLLKVKNVLQMDNNRIPSPPLRTSSGGSGTISKFSRTASGGSLSCVAASPASDRSRSSENQAPGKLSLSRRGKGIGLHHLVSTEALGRFFG
jgi:hypothetical protein